jgi:hypothetical protein
MIRIQLRHFALVCSGLPFFLVAISATVQVVAAVPCFQPCAALVAILL